MKADKSTDGDRIEITLPIGAGRTRSLLRIKGALTGKAKPTRTRKRSLASALKAAKAAGAGSAVVQPDGSVAVAFDNPTEASNANPWHKVIVDLQKELQ